MKYYLENEEEFREGISSLIGCNVSIGNYLVDEEYMDAIGFNEESYRFEVLKMIRDGLYKKVAVFEADERFDYMEIETENLFDFRDKESIYKEIRLIIESDIGEIEIGIDKLDIDPSFISFE